MSSSAQDATWVVLSCDKYFDVTLPLFALLSKLTKQLTEGRCHFVLCHCAFRIKASSYSYRLKVLARKPPLLPHTHRHLWQRL